MSGFPRVYGPVLMLLAMGAAQSYSQMAAPASVLSESSLAHVTFNYENQQLQPAKYTLVVDEQGLGHFHSEPGDVPIVDTAAYQPLAQPLDRPVQLTRPVVDQIFAVAREQKFFATACDDKKDKIAFQGMKQLSYQGPGGSGSCTYNWSKSTAIQKVTALFESIAFTLEEGRRLEVEHKHDRLALDAELEVLLNAAKDGRALEMQTIQPTLQEIIDDEAVLDRARSRARKLLDAGSTTATLR